MLDFHAATDAIRDDLITMRRDLHAHPELAFEEIRTAGIVARTLNALGFEVQTGVGKTGVIGVLDGGAPGPQTLLLRFDMDALPIREQVDVAFKSQTDNKMHACGHDAHTSIGLGVARLLAEHRDTWRGTVKFVFQPAEEIGQGARAMIDDGALHNPTPTRSLSMHVWSTLPAGTVAITPGPVLAAIDKYDIVIGGSGTHGASPHRGVDPIVTAAAVINALASVQSRNRNPLEPAVISVGTVHGGSAPNIIPETVAISGTLRAFDDATMDMLRDRVRVIAEQTAAAHGARADVSFVETGVPPVVNDHVLATRIGNVARGLFGAANVRDDFKLAVSEDCALFLRAAPGVFALVGAGNAAAGIAAPHHSPRFQIDERSLTDGAALMFASAIELLNGE